jgi:glycosyltransferase involved in cell wall biosynthesis
VNLAVVLEYRFYRSGEGGFWTDSAFATSFWDRFLEVFETVRVVARCRQVPSASLEWKRVDGERIAFGMTPYYVGLFQYLVRAWQVREALVNHVTVKDAVILRAPSHLANILADVLERRQQPYGIEVVGDPYDVFAPGAVKHPLRFFFRWWFSRQLRRQCLGACGVAYVTQYALQKRYPPSELSFTSSYSSVELTTSAFRPTPTFGAFTFATYFSDVELSHSAFRSMSLPRFTLGAHTFTLITVASLEQMYKGTDILIDAVAIAVREGLDLRLIVVGDGKHQPKLAARAARKGLGERVKFIGRLPAGEPVRRQLDMAHLFVLPSRTEGMPRAMIEAMARGLPCIGTMVGGIPELIPPEDMVPPNDALLLARKIHEVLSNPDRIVEMGQRNLCKARHYREEVLRERRQTFYRHVRRKTEEWQKAKGIF